MTVPQRLSFSAQLTNCNVAPCWHIDLSILGLLLSISIHFRKSFSCCMRFFQKNDPWAGLGRILRNHRKTLMSSVYLCLFSWEIRLVLNTDWKLMSFCHGNEHQRHWSKHLEFRPSWLFHRGCLSLHSCQTAILLYVGTLNSAYWAFKHPSISIHLSNKL